MQLKLPKPARCHGRGLGIQTPTPLTVCSSQLVLLVQEFDTTGAEALAPKAILIPAAMVGCKYIQREAAGRNRERRFRKRTQPGLDHAIGAPG
ncbi:MAG TPA: hypothetical protein VN709_12190 [Terriglobales bacterium]|nr:hypothetical protein [Terriglobales bacterium]